MNNTIYMYIYTHNIHTYYIYAEIAFLIDFILFDFDLIEKYSLKWWKVQNGLTFCLTELTARELWPKWKQEIEWIGHGPLKTRSRTWILQAQDVPLQHSSQAFITRYPNNYYPSVFNWSLFNLAQLNDFMTILFPSHDFPLLFLLLLLSSLMPPVTLVLPLFSHFHSSQPPLVFTLSLSHAPSLFLLPS